MIDLLPLPYQIKETKTFKDMFKALDKMGYRKGLTYQTLPYDYSRSYRNNALNKTFVPNIKRLFKLTGKPVVIAAHSLGNVNTLYQLNKLSSEFKNKHIKMWFSMAPPFLGAMKAIQDTLGGEDMYFFLKTLGFHFKASKECMTTFPVMYELALVNMYTMYAKEPWFQWVISRLEYEKGQISAEESGLSFWPTMDEECTPANFTEFSPKCNSGLEDMRERASVVIDGKDYFLDDLKKIYEDWPLQDYSKDYFDKFHDPEFLKLTNPEVPMVLIFGKAFATAAQVVYEGKITDFTDKGEYPKYTEVHGFGDNRVSSNSALVPGIKWAYEFEHREKDSNYKVNFYEDIL